MPVMPGMMKWEFPSRRSCEPLVWTVDELTIIIKYCKSATLKRSSTLPVETICCRYSQAVNDALSGFQNVSYIFPLRFKWNEDIGDSASTTFACCLQIAIVALLRSGDGVTLEACARLLKRFICPLTQVLCGLWLTVIGPFRFTSRPIHSRFWIRLGYARTHNKSQFAKIIAKQTAAIIWNVPKKIKWLVDAPNQMAADSRASSLRSLSLLCFASRSSPLRLPAVASKRLRCESERSCGADRIVLHTFIGRRPPDSLFRRCGASARPASRRRAHALWTVNTESRQVALHAPPIVHALE